MLGDVKKNKKQNKTKKEQEIKPIFMVLWSNAFNASVIYNTEVLEHFVTRNYTQRLVIVQNSLWISCHFGTEIRREDLI